jgi:hypothetical protein
MSNSLPDKARVLDAIRSCASQLGRVPSRAEFKAHSSMTEYQVLQHFPSWKEAVSKAGLTPHAANVRADDRAILEDWGNIVRKLRHIPTRDQYRREGNYSPGVFEKHFGPWSSLPDAFRRLLGTNPEWSDVAALLPVASAAPIASRQVFVQEDQPSSPSDLTPRHSKLERRPTYGNPIDFRGLRHEPVNEQGVVFLFGMVARELGYHVEAVQTGFPDCEAKRQVGPGKWQRVRIEFEYESRNFRDHGHSASECDVIVCWRHNWPDCPQGLEVLELAGVLRTLAVSDE